MIYGKRIRLRRLEKEDITFFYKWVNDPQVTKGISIYLPIGFWEEEEWFDSKKKIHPEERPLAIDMRDGEHWRLIGNTSFFNRDTVSRSAEIGIMLGDKSIWNQGYGTESMQLMIRHGFATLNLHRIELRVLEENARAIRAYEKVGFVHEGRQRKAIYQHGKYQDILMMSILRDEWEKVNDEHK